MDTNHKWMMSKTNFSGAYYTGIKHSDSMLQAVWPYWAIFESICKQILLQRQSKYRVTRLGNLLPFGRLFKAHGDNYFDPNRPNFWRLFGRFLKDGSNLNFLCYKENLNLKFWRNCHFGQLLHQKEYQKYVFLAIKEVRTDTKYHFGQLLLQKEDPK